MTKAPTDGAERGGLFRRRPENPAPQLQGLPALDEAPESGPALRIAREVLATREQRLAEVRLRENDARAALDALENAAPDAFAEGKRGVAEELVDAERAVAVAAREVTLASRTVEDATKAVAAAEADARKEIDAISVIRVREDAAEFLRLGGLAVDKLEEMRRLKDAALSLGLPSAKFWDLGDAMCTKDGLGQWGTVNGLARAAWDGPEPERRPGVPLARVRLLRKSNYRPLVAINVGEVVTVPKAQLEALVREGVVETVDEADQIPPEILAARDEWQGDPDAPTRKVRFTKTFLLRGGGNRGALRFYGPGEIVTFTAALAERIVNTEKVAQYVQPVAEEAAE